MTSDKPRLKVVGGTAAKVVSDFPIAAEDVDRLVQELGTNRQLARLDPEHLRAVISTAAQRKGGIPELRDVHEVRRSLGQDAGKIIPPDPERMKALDALIRKNAEAEKARKAAAQRVRPSSSGGSTYREMMAEANSMLDRSDKQRQSLEKGLAGMGFIMAALIAVGAISSFQHAKKEDENGRQQVQMTHVGVGLLMTAFAVGAAIMAHEGWKGATVSR